MPVATKLRSPRPEKPFRVVLLEPEIPPNTGAVARTCAATCSALHLVGKLGFSIDDHAVRRAGLDYWPLVDLHQHADLTALKSEHPKVRLHFFSANAKRSYLEADFRPGDAFVFGCESVGLPKDLLAANADRVWAIPTMGGVRSLNLSNTVSIIVYEALRQSGSLQVTFREPPSAT